MAEINQINVNSVDYTLKDSTAIAPGTYASSSHVHEMRSTLAVGYSNWGTIGTINTTNNNTTTAVQLASWGMLGLYEGWCNNKTNVSIAAEGNIVSDYELYTLTKTAARPWTSTYGNVLDKVGSIEITSTGHIILYAFIGTGSSRTMGAGGCNSKFFLTGILNPSSVGATSSGGNPAYLKSGPPL